MSIIQAAEDFRS